MAGPDREKRRTPRLQPFVAPCKVIEGERRFAAYLADLSVRGARVSSNTALPASASKVILEIRFSRRKAYSRLPGTIQWRRPGDQPGEALVFGVTFESITVDEQTVLESVVREFQQRAALLA